MKNFAKFSLILLSLISIFSISTSAWSTYIVRKGNYAFEVSTIAYSGRETTGYAYISEYYCDAKNVYASLKVKQNSQILGFKTDHGETWAEVEGTTSNAWNIKSTVTADMPSNNIIESKTSGGGNW